MKCLRHVGRKWLNLNSFKNTLGTCSLLVQYKQHFTSMGLGYSLLTPGLDMTHMLWWVMVMGTTKSKGQPAEKEADFYACTNFWNLVYYWTPGTDFATGYTFICAYKCRHSSCAHTCPFSGCQLQLAHASKHQVTSLRDPHQKNHNSEFLQKQNITSPPKNTPAKEWCVCLWTHMFALEALPSDWNPTKVSLLVHDLWFSCAKTAHIATKTYESWSTIHFLLF